MGNERSIREYRLLDGGVGIGRLELDGLGEPEDGVY
jgi:hypothetical protein